MSYFSFKNMKDSANNHTLYSTGISLNALNSQKKHFDIGVCPG